VPHQRAPFRVLHHKVEDPAQKVGLQQADDVGVAQAGQDGGLLLDLFGILRDGATVGAALGGRRGWLGLPLGPKGC
jgi:hypothetical protein